jgi:putative acetyltransferase
LADATELARLTRATIRTINAKDHPENIIRAWSGGNTASAYRKMLKERIQYVAIENQRIIGFTDFLPQGELTSLYVHPKYIGKGVGKKLLTFIENIAKKMGIKILRCQSSKNAKDFYLKHGYIVIKPDFWIVEGLPPMQVYQMEKKL